MIKRSERNKMGGLTHVTESGRHKVGALVFRKKEDGTKQAGTIVELQPDCECPNHSAYGHCLSGMDILWQGDDKPTYHYSMVWYRDCCGA